MTTHPQTSGTAVRRPGATAPVALSDFIGEAMLLLGAGTTVLLQLAMRGVGHGVADHSTTLQRPLDRLRTTMTYVYAVTLGSEKEKKAIVRMVNKAHVPVRSETYNAFDPELQLWVAATLYKNGIDRYQQFFGELDDASADNIYRQSAVYGTALQVKPDQWPETRQEFDRYWDGMIETLTSDDRVRGYVRGLLGGGDSPWPVKLLLPLNSLLARGMLPARIRRELDLPWSPRDQRRYDLVMKLLIAVYRYVPRPVRQFPAAFYLWDMRRRMRRGGHLI